MTFTEARFYMTPEGRRFAEFIRNLKSSGIHRNDTDVEDGCILDLAGNPVKGKKLSSFRLYTDRERFEIDHKKSAAEKERLRKEYDKTAAAKVLELVSLKLRVGLKYHYAIGMLLEFIVRFLTHTLGVNLTVAQQEKSIALLVDLNNNSNLWQTNGWAPSVLSCSLDRDLP